MISNTPAFLGSSAVEQVTVNHLVGGSIPSRGAILQGVIVSSKLSDNGMLPAQDLYYLLGGKEKIKLLDATYSLPQAGLSPFDAFLSNHIEGAQFFDIDAIADQTASLPHTVPTPEYFAACVSALGISNDDHVVVYDQSGAYMASARAWWMFRLFGHEQVYVLEGGLDAWRYGGFRTVSGPAPAPPPGMFTARLRPELLATKEQLVRNFGNAAARIVDARPPARFAGRAPEPWDGKRAGHIPGSVNLPHGDVLESATRNMKPAGAIERLFADAGLTPDERMIMTCGSGVTACTLALALYKATGRDSAVYDGSWSEWGDENAGTPVEVSA